MGHVYLRTLYHREIELTVSFSFFFIVIGGFFGGLFAAPIARAFLAGLASAREPVHRVTPENPRVFFQRAFWKRAKYLPIVLAVALCIAFCLGYFPAVRSNLPVGFALILGIDLVSLLLIILLTIVAVALLIAPRCDLSWPIATLGTLLGAAWAFCGLLIPGNLIPRSWHTVTFESHSETGAVMRSNTSILPLYVLLLACLVTGLVWWWARSRGDKWYRFDS